MVFLDPAHPSDLARRVRAGLEGCFGSTADVVARAPGRVNLIGEHTDYNAGLVLPVALPHATYVAAATRGDDVVRIASAQQDDAWEGTLAETAGATGWASYAAGVLWALREAGHDLPGLDLFVDSTVPLGAGLSSSAAIECAVAVAALASTGVEVSAGLREQVVSACIRAETEVAGAPTGGMDQSVAVHAEPGTALLIDFQAHTHQPVRLALGDRMLLVTDTRVSHELTDGGYGARRADCEEAARLLGLATLRDAALSQVAMLPDERIGRRARHIVTEIARVRAVVEALEARDWDGVGTLFAASHASMRDDFEISTPELDLAVEAAVAAGADGARMTGGGFGGSTVAIVPAEAVADVAGAIDRAFAAAGHGAPAHLLATPSGGAELLS